MAVFDTDLLQNGDQVLTDQVVAAVLHEDAQSRGYKRAVPHALGLEEFSPPASAGFIFDLESFSDLGKFDMWELSRCVVFSMVLYQDGEGFLATVFADKPSWTGILLVDTFMYVG